MRHTPRWYATTIEEETNLARLDAKDAACPAATFIAGLCHIFGEAASNLSPKLALLSNVRVRGGSPFNLGTLDGTKRFIEPGFCGTAHS